MKRFLINLIVSSLFLLVVGCASSKPGDSTRINDDLVGFTTAVQGARWSEALKYITADEAEAIAADDYTFKLEYQLAAKRLQFSTLMHRPWKLDYKGRLVGMKAVMDESNERYRVSKNQKEVGTNLDEMEQDRIQRHLDEGQNILMNQDEKEQGAAKVDVYTNKLTEEEKQKYGSIKDDIPPEDQTEDIENSDYESSEPVSNVETLDSNEEGTVDNPDEEEEPDGFNEGYYGDEE